MNKKVNVYSFNEECYVYLNDYKQLEEENQELKEDIKYLFNAINKNNIHLTATEKNVFNKYYLIFNRKGSEVNGC